MRAILLYAGGVADSVLEGKASLPEVPVGEDEFVELDEEGNPKKRVGRRARPAAARPRRHKKPPPRRKVPVTVVPERRRRGGLARRGGSRSRRCRCRGHSPGGDASGQRPAAPAGRPQRAAARRITPLNRPAHRMRTRRPVVNQSLRTPPPGRYTMNITADTVKQLRERTGAGMMECKKALVETQGDLDAAAELMRKSGLAKADKKAARVAAEGTVAVERSGNERRARGSQLRNRLRGPQR